MVMFTILFEILARDSSVMYLVHMDHPCFSYINVHTTFIIMSVILFNCLRFA